MMGLEPTRVDSRVTRPLRGRVLRPGQSERELMVPLEEDPRSGWFAVVVDDRVVSCGGVLPEPRPDGPADGWRVRAMATDPNYRSRGLGAAVLGACAGHVVASGGGEIWCTARVKAAAFYLEKGFEALGEPFDLHGLGEHLLLAGDPDVVVRATRPTGQAQAG